MNSHSYIQKCSLSVFVIVAGAWMFGDANLALRTAVAGLAVVLNLLLTERASRRFLLVAAGDASSEAVGGFVLKQLTTVPLAVVLMSLLGAEPLGLAMLALFSGISLQAAVQIVQSRQALALFDVTVEESAC